MNAIDLILHGQPVTARLIKRKGARNITMRLKPELAEVRVTLPPYVPYKAAEAFIAERHVWLLRHWPREAYTPPSFESGDVITLFDEAFVIEHVAAARSRVEMQDGKILVHGTGTGWQSRLKAHLKTYTRTRLSEMTRAHAKNLDVRIAKVTVREMRSRWGSCSTSRSLSFNWRLCFAPKQVADYVTAHEVAHLVHHNHSEKFWELVKQLDATYESSEHWLKKNGHSVFNILP